MAMVLMNQSNLEKEVCLNNFVTAMGLNFFMTIVLVRLSTYISNVPEHL